ncbi:hypothetical protein L249_1792 [Ophiocordyceps polyrhachis-furcata BCC 54312]|uniref:Hydrophobin n=1 Tax=Ophiocordyceps polyrhachis-furcata BCC 54312 TaxID=1330021 RepID=A0A367LRI8_9HYPO|nr:hypothetical protein L249_1792 [Ophiocordyceps polyrhachis-furcata BCC 54312]
MKFFATVLALAAVAIAAPADIEPRTGGSTCSAPNEKPVCCNTSGSSGLLTSLLNPCAVQVLGSNCQAKAYCCKTDASTGGLVNVNALNCVSLIS